LAPDAADVLAQALKTGRLSARGLHRVRRVARTVADLQEEPGDVITAGHVAIALSLRVDAVPATPDDRAVTP
jgi:magnesium chelatase family protein